MPETTWGSDVAPHGLQAFESPATAGTWAMADALVSQAFAAVPDPWTLVYWGIVGMDPTSGAIAAPVMRPFGPSAIW